MFPHLQLSIGGLQENVKYCVLVEMQPVSQHRHKYCGSNTFDENGNKSGNSGGWTKAGQAESQPDIEHRIYLHSESPARGTHWMKHVVNFNKLKITNNATERSSNVCTHDFTKSRHPELFLMRDSSRQSILFIK